jgi:hypothetical protein
VDLDAVETGAKCPLGAGTKRLDDARYLMRARGIENGTSPRLV